jgi:hypothetical protein
VGAGGAEVRGTSCSVCLLQNWLISWWILSNTQSCSNIPFEWAETRGGGASRKGGLSCLLIHLIVVHAIVANGFEHALFL